MNLKAGIKLSKTKEEWQISNDYFKSVFNLHGDIRNVEEEIICLQKTLYELKFNMEILINVNPNTDYQWKYINPSKPQLKKKLATFKQQNDDRYTSEIRYISKLVRSKYIKKHLNREYTIFL